MHPRPAAHFPVIAAAVAGSLLALVSGCVANPGPPPVVDEAEAARLTGTTSATPTTTPAIDAANRTAASVGVDPLNAGLNPHLIADNSQLVEDIADLVLPSTFVGEEMDANLLDSAAEVPPPAGIAQRVRYELSSAAQWSDGTPISGADFDYLWRAMASTAGVKDPAGYRAIQAVNTSGGGRVVTVDFATPVANWRGLFHHLVPSHLLEGVDFATALADDIPAAAGRYQVASVDRARGVIKLNRNDRYWGTNPANLDVVNLRAVRSQDQAVNMLRSGQISFADITPRQTLREALSLLPGVEAGTAAAPRQLRLHLAVADDAARAELSALVDTAQVARLATGRTADLSVPYGGTGNPEGSTAALAGLGRPVRLGVDPTDETASAAAGVIADQLRARGISAEVVAERMSLIAGQLLPTGAVDAVLAWEDLDVDAFAMSNLFLCAADPGATTATTPAPVTPAPTEDGAASSAPGSAEADGASVAWAGSLSGACPAGAAETRARILSGELEPAAALELVRELNVSEHYYLPILDETRVHALGRGIVGPGPDISSWGAGIATAPDWELE